MKRFFFTLILVLLVVWALRANHHPGPEFKAPPPMRWHGPRPHHDGPATIQVAEARRQTQKALAETGRALDEARHEVHKAFGEARKEIRHALREVSDEVRQAYHEAVGTHRGPQPPVPPAPPVPAVPAREDAEGIPVPIVPGTRVTTAEARPPAPAPTRLVSRTPQATASPHPTASPAPALPTSPAVVEGQPSATQERAMDDARKALQRKVVEWLGSEGVPTSWTPPARMVQAMILETQVHTVNIPILNEKDLEPMFVAELKADFSPRHQEALVEVYNRELVQHRLVSLGGALSFVLICLGVISGYIRADEATKGYYTNRLRMLAAAGVGAAGVILYNMVT
jgi:hypothetical protein